MLMTETQALTATVCACCGVTFWDWADSIYTICNYCDGFEPLEFDDWE